VAGAFETSVTAVTRARIVTAGHAVTMLVAGAVFLLAFMNGTYAPDRRLGFGVVVWWAVLLVAVVGARRAAWTRSAAAVTGTFALLAAWTLLSVAWASNAETAYAEFTRTALYVGVFALVVSLARREAVGAWSDGLALGVVAVAATALASRFYPHSVGSTAGTGILPSLGSRLSYPLGYWNALGVLAALGVPLVLSSALRARARVARGLWLGALPLLATTIYLTSSRGAFATATVAVAVFVLLSRRWAALGALAIAVAGSAATVAVVADRAALANGRGTAIAAAEGRSAALLVGLCAVGVVAVYAAALSLPTPARRPSSSSVWIVAGVVALVAAVGIASAHPVARFDRFRQPPAAAAAPQADPVKAHLLSASGSGRWQFWQAALSEYRTRPITGRGAGSYGEWWAQHGTLAVTVQDAHSLYLETLGELGWVGLALLLLALLAGARAVLRGASRCDAGLRSAAAGIGGAYAGFLVAAGIDWMWEFTAVAVVAIASVALASTLGGSLALLASLRSRAAARGAFAAIAASLVVAEGIPLLAQVEIGRSQASARSGDLSRAVAQAQEAVRIQSWAASPHLQLALAEESAGEFAAAQRAALAAIARDPAGWQPRVVAARIALEEGDFATALRRVDEARALNPRSAIFRNR
jgi:hypothetical protein